MPRLSSKERVVVSIDPSIGGAAICGGGINWPINNLILEVKTAGEPAKELVGRISRWKKHVQQIMSVVDRYDPELLLIEGYSFGSKGKSILDLAELGGLLRKELLQLRAIVVEVPPHNLKLFVTGKGNANKTQVIASLARQHKAQYASNDEYDALGLWLMGRAILTGKTSSASQRKALEKLKVK